MTNSGVASPEQRYASLLEEYNKDKSRKDIVEELQSLERMLGPDVVFEIGARVNAGAKPGDFYNLANAPEPPPSFETYAVKPGEELVVTDLMELTKEDLLTKRSHFNPHPEEAVSGIQVSFKFGPTSVGYVRYIATGNIYKSKFDFFSGEDFTNTKVEDISRGVDWQNSDTFWNEVSIEIFRGINDGTDWKTLQEGIFLRDDRIVFDKKTFMDYLMLLRDMGSKNVVNTHYATPNNIFNASFRGSSELIRQSGLERSRSRKDFLKYVLEIEYSENDCKEFSSDLLDLLFLQLELIRLNELLKGNFSTEAISKIRIYVSFCEGEVRRFKDKVLKRLDTVTKILMPSLNSQAPGKLAEGRSTDTNIVLGAMSGFLQECGIAPSILDPLRS